MWTVDIKLWECNSLTAKQTFRPHLVLVRSFCIVCTKLKKIIPVMKATG